LREVLRAFARARSALAALVAVAALAGLVAAPAADAQSKQKGVAVSVMSRNLFLGADLTPGLNANSAAQFISANGAILREVDQTNFPVRAKGLAAEIKAKKPDLVGLQEAAWWRTAPQDPSKPLFSQGESGNFYAVDTKYDFVRRLLDELNAKTNKKYKGYKVAVINPEFDFEAPADYDNNPSTGPVFGGEIQARLTMRDAILVRKGSDVTVTKPRSGHFANLFTPNISGITVPITRGWTSVDATATRGTGEAAVQQKFRFVNTHLEAFDDETQRPSIRALQAQELISARGPAGTSKRVILAGDLNSNVPPVKPGDEQAYQVMLDGGFTARSTSNPLGCCVPSVITGPASAFDHKVDHIMTSDSRKHAKLVESAVTGLTPVKGFFNSDHAGLFSELKLK
jgi:hypothetical protein